MNFIHISSFKNQKILSILSISLFSAWLLSVLFEGQVLYSIIESNKQNITYNSVAAIIAHFLGLVICGLIVKNQVQAKKTTIISICLCIIGSLILYMRILNITLLYLIVICMSFFAGLVIASWSFYYKEYSTGEERLKTAADVLIYSNILMVIINIFTINVSVLLGLTISILALICSLVLSFKLESCHENKTDNNGALENKLSKSTLLRSVLMLFLFVLVITINSGLMYSVVVPEFSNIVRLTSFYWATPYIVALILMRNLNRKVNRAYVLYIALSMIGLSFLLFTWLDRSVLNFLLINTLMLGAFGVCDLFWWSILGGFLDFFKNPAIIFGLGLSMNVLGIMIGGFIGNYLGNMHNDNFNTLLIALIVVFTVVIMLPVLYTYLARVLKNHAFLYQFSNQNQEKQTKNSKDIHSELLTAKELEIVKLVLEGYTYRAISEMLFISENTTKYHVKNIYQKLNINKKSELINIFRSNTNV